MIFFKGKKPVTFSQQKRQEKMPQQQQLNIFKKASANSN